jgi:transposase
VLAGKEYREDSDSPPTFFDSLIDQKKWALVEATKTGQSVTAAAQLFGVAVATAMAWAAEAGIHTPKRAKLFTLSLRKNAIQMLRRGSSKEDVASTAGTSVQSITLLLRTEPGLRSDWNQAKFDHIQKRSRASWSRMASKLHPVSGHFLRKLLPAEFAWLYRNDRSWLEDFNSALPRPERSNNSNIHWDTRDAIFSQAVDAAALAIYLARPGCRIRSADLCNRIPDLKARLSDLDQLPLTHAAIARATRSRAAD